MDTPALPKLQAVKPIITFSQLTLVLLTFGFHRTLAVRIINCNNNKVEILEDSPAPVTCVDITSIYNVYWRRGDGVNIGECSPDGMCYPASDNDYRLSRSPQSTESQLTLVPDYRRHAGLTVTCQDRVSTASCTLVIRHVEGPTDVVINKTHQPSTNSSRVAMLSCTTTAVVYPGVNFTWTPGVCQNETHTARSSTCTVILDAKEERTSVTCKAINSIDSGISVSTSVWLQINDLRSVTSPTQVIIRVVVAVGGIAVIVAVAVILILQRRCRLQNAPADLVPLGSKEVMTDLHADETHPTNEEDGYTSICTREDSATEWPTAANAGIDQLDMHENKQTLPDRTYDTTCRLYEEHKYSDLQAMTTVSK